MFLRLLWKLKTDESGAALTEYLVLIGLLAGGAAAAVGLFGTEISNAFTGWDTYIGDNAGPE